MTFHVIFFFCIIILNAGQTDIFYLQSPTVIYILTSDKSISIYTFQDDLIVGHNRISCP